MTELEPGVLNKFLVDTYYAKNPNVSILDPFQRLRLFVQMHYENYPNPPHDLPTQHLIGANAMIKALTEDQKIMLWNLFADPGARPPTGRPTHEPPWENSYKSEPLCRG